MSIIRGKMYNPHDRFSFEAWEPFRDFHFDSTLVAPRPAFSNDATRFIVNSKINWEETAEAYVYKIGLPGFKRNEVKLVLEEGNILCISGERSVEKEEKTDKWHHVEHCRGRFCQRLMLPGDAKADKVKAHVENGVLVITVPKKEKKITSQIIHIS